MPQTKYRPVGTIVNEVVQTNRTVFHSIDCQCTFCHREIQTLSQIIVKYAPSVISQITIVVPREETVIIIIRNLITIWSHFRWIHRSKVSGCTLIALVVECVSFVCQLQTVKIASLILIPHGFQQFFVGTRLQVIENSRTLCNRIVFYQNLVSKIFHISAQVIFTPPCSIYIDYRQSPILSFEVSGCPPSVSVTSKCASCMRPSASGSFGFQPAIIR